MPIEHLIEFGTFIGGSLTAVAYLPQLSEMIKHKNSKGHSLIAWYLWLFGVVVILAYAVYIEDLVLISLHILYFICISLVIFLIYKYRQKNEPR